MIEHRLVTDRRTDTVHNIQRYAYALHRLCIAWQKFDRYKTNIYWILALAAVERLDYTSIQEITHRPT